MNDRLKALLQPDTKVTPAPAAPATNGDGKPPEQEKEDLETEGCCEWLRGVRDRAVALEFELHESNSTREWPAPDYSLIKHRWWEPGGSFRVEYMNGLKIKVTGWGLRRIYELFLRNRVTRLKEQRRDPVREKSSGEKSWIHSIEVELPEEEEKE